MKTDGAPDLAAVGVQDRELQRDPEEAGLARAEVSAEAGDMAFPQPGRYQGDHLATDEVDHVLADEVRHGRAQGDDPVGVAGGHDGLRGGADDRDVRA